jgi:hypothetical protein
MSPTDGSPERTDAEGPTLDRAEARKWAKELLGSLEALLADADATLDSYRNAVETARVRRRQASIAERLRNLSVQDLAKRGSNIPRKRLLDDGVRSALEVLNRGEEGLLKITGIGERSASQLINLAEAAARAAGGPASIRRPDELVAARR